MADLGVAEADSTQIITDLARTVSYYAATVSTSNVSGDETATYASAVDKTWIFLKRENRYLLTREGILDVADAYLFVPPSDTLNKHDRVVVDGETYEITPSCVIALRKFGATAMFKYATLAKVA